MQSNRSVFWDIVKGVAILLVVIGHQIQGSCGNTEVFAEDPIFKFIYGFHMPLFMLISGYFFFYSTHITIIELIKCNKYTNLIFFGNALKYKSTH